LIATAAVLAVLTLYYYTDSWIAVVVFFAAAAAFVMYQKTRGGKPASHACLRCGAKMNPNARQCDACGSASWTVN
jgi:uncharacterized OB-fold protein